MEISKISKVTFVSQNKVFLQALNKLNEKGKQTCKKKSIHSICFYSKR